jgi:transcriptional regulator with XRE-family HTH domain
MTLRELIQHRQTTGAALGRALGWSRATVSDYVTGRRRPKLETAARIAAALDAVVIVPVEKSAPFGYAPEPVTKN